VIVEVFCGADRWSRAAAIHDLFRQELGPAVSLVVHDVDEATADQGFRLAERYAKLLQAAVPPERDLGLELEALGARGARSHVRAHGPVEARLRAAYSVADVFPRLRAALFPAVGVRERMVLVPLGQHARLEPAAEGRDVVEVDFDDEEALGAAVRTVGRRLRAELRREREDDDPRCRPSPDVLPHGRATRVMLELDLPVEGPRELPVELRAAGAEVEPRLASVVVGGSPAPAVLAVSVAPHAPGDVPLEVAVGSLPPLLAFHHLWLRAC
jgi:hypothetical protein